jgi:acyl-CoA synthetase (AMP-forming)/AMP-acid ligase II
MSSERLSIIHGPAYPALVNWTFNDVIRHRLEHHPDNIVVYSQHQNEALTYRDLNKLADKLATGLRDVGIRRGDRVGVLLSNRSEYAVVR